MVVDRWVVIDADIARAARAESPSQEALEAAELLEALRETEGLGAAFCEELADEWARHASKYATRWWAELVSQRRSCEREVPVSVTNAIDAALSAKLGGGALRARRKDAHLVGLAITVPAPIASRDGRARSGFRRLCSKRSPWREVEWAIIPADRNAILAWCKDQQKHLPRVCP